MPWQTLLTAQASGGTNSPIVNRTTLTEQPLKSFATGHVNRVPALLGVNRDEDLTGTATTAAAYTSLIDSQYGAESSEVLPHYPLTRFHLHTSRPARSPRTQTRSALPWCAISTCRK